MASSRGTTNVDFVRAGVSNLPFADYSFDAACTRYSAHHWSQPSAAVAEIARVLKPGAPFVLSDSVGFDDAALDTYLNALELLRDPSHVRNATVAAWTACLENVGFRVTAVRPWRVDLDTTTWLNRLAPARWRRSAARHMLLDAPAPARIAMNIAPGGASFTIPCAMITAMRKS